MQLPNSESTWTSLGRQQDQLSSAGNMQPGRWVSTVQSNPTLATPIIFQAGQAAAFGHLFSEAVRAGQSAVQTQHPGLYFQLGAEYAISRWAMMTIDQPERHPYNQFMRHIQEEAG